MNTSTDAETLKSEIADLEAQLSIARTKLSTISNATPSPQPRPFAPPPPSTHFLLLLSDTALPLGSFAFSSGLESYLAHHPASSRTKAPPPPIQPFLSLALQTLASTSLPYLIAAYRDPERLLELDDEFDACMLCHVARRASVSQGRALLTVWERGLCGDADAAVGDKVEEEGGTARRVLREMGARLKQQTYVGAAASGGGGTTTTTNIQTTTAHAHFPPLWAVVTRALDIPLHNSTYVFLLNHAKAILSAAVRASVLGPYQAQAVLGSRLLRGELEALMRRYWDTKVEEAGQCVPGMDLWVGRHELLYSRIFNS
ncbi:MAG: hypothetical protein Q9220_004532 [cf. Caloplaca sp. 1 TL-2023]